MANLDILTYGFSLMSDQGAFGYSTVSLLEAGTRHILIDTGPASRRGWVMKALETRGLEPDDIDTLVLTHLHWDHCQNADMFRNARVLVHPKEIDYSRNPNRADANSASYFADMLSNLSVNPISDGDVVADGVRVIDTPGHTKGHISLVVTVDGEEVLVAGDAMPDGGTIRRGVPYNIFWDVKDAAESVEKMLDSSKVFYPGHDRPFKLDGDKIDYLNGPTVIEVYGNNEGGEAPALAYRVSSHREPNIDLVQKGFESVNPTMNVTG